MDPVSKVRYSGSVQFRGVNMKRILALAASLAACSSAHAIGIGAKVGTTGIGGDVAMSVFPLGDARIGWAGGSLSRSDSTSGARYDGKLKLNNLNAPLDFHPLGPPFPPTRGGDVHEHKSETTRPTA